MTTPLLLTKIPSVKDDIGNATVFLFSPAASYITGSILGKLLVQSSPISFVCANSPPFFFLFLLFELILLFPFFFWFALIFFVFDFDSFRNQVVDGGEYHLRATSSLATNYPRIFLQNDGKDFSGLLSKL